MGLLRDIVGGSFEFVESGSVLDGLLECRYNALDPVDYGRKHLASLMSNQQAQEASLPLVDVMPEKVAPVGPKLTVVEQTPETTAVDPEDQASRLARAQEALEGAFYEAA